MQANSFQAQRAIIFLLLTVMSGVAWWYLIFQHETMAMMPMAGTWMPPKAHQAWSSVDFANTFTMWAVMMAAMMMPSAMPMVFGFMRVCRMHHFSRHPSIDAMGFVWGYFFVWLVFCTIATATQWQLHSLGRLSPMMESWDTTFNAELIILAGLYQLTPCKAICLDHCRATAYPGQDCHSKPILMGLHHGLYCVGSCWALMSMMFAVGIMNLLWTGLLTLMVVLEKVVPIKPIWLRFSSGLALLAWGGYLLIPLDLLFKGACFLVGVADVI